MQVLASALASVESCKWTKVPIERISATELGALTAPQFFGRFEDTPVIITGLERSAPVWSIQDINTDCKGTQMPVCTFDARPEGNWARLKNSGTMAFDDFAQYILSSLDDKKEELKYGFDYNVGAECPILRAKIVVPPFATECLLQNYMVPNERGDYTWPTLMVGPRGTRSELHTDNGGLPFWMAVHKGHKHFRVLPHGANAHVTGTTPREILPPALDKPFSGDVLQDYMVGGSYQFEVFAPDFAAFPKLCEATIYDGVMAAGEVIYIPNAAAHGVVNQDTTIATTANFFHPADERQQRWLDKVCEDPADFGFGNAEWGKDRCSKLKAHVECDRTSHKWTNKALSRFMAPDEPETQCEDASSTPEEHLAAWIRDSPVPKEPADGWPSWDLADVKVYDLDHVMVEGRHLMSHAEPPRKFDSEAERQEVLLVIAKLLRRSLVRTQRDALALLQAAAPTDVDLLLSSARALFDSVEDFYYQAAFAINEGWSQLDPKGPDFGEYGPETNFWLKFRPYLHCKHTARLGKELGGQKAWCNPEYMLDVTKPRFVLSAGSGDDFTYEDFVLQAFPNSTVFVADCFSEEDGKPRDNRMKYLQQCLHGEDEGDTEWMPDSIRQRFVTLPQIVKELKARFSESLKFDNFHLLKANIEAYEYSMFGYAMRDADENMLNTIQINIEMHRIGMAGGLAWSSLVFAELLFATFLSGGFHPVFTEKWHDSSAAQDIVFVNASWYMQSELYLVRQAWKHPRSARKLYSAIPPLQENVRTDSGFDGYPELLRWSKIQIHAKAKDNFECFWLQPETFELHSQGKLGDEVTEMNSLVGHMFLLVGDANIEAILVQKGVHEYTVGKNQTDLAVSSVKGLRKVLRHRTLKNRRPFTP